MKLGIYSLKKILYQGTANAVNCKTEAGEITVLEHHRPLISVLQKGVVKITDEKEKDHYIQVRAGFLEVSNNDARMIVEEI